MPLAATGLAAVVEREVTTPTESPITAHIAAAVTTIHRRLLFASNLRSLGRRACLALGAEADPSGEEAGGGGGVAPEVSAGDGAEVAVDTGGPERVSSSGFVGSKSLMMALLLFGAISKVPSVPPRTLGADCDDVEDHATIAWARRAFDLATRDPPVRRTHLAPDRLSGGERR
jgi:hypothetical protein